MKRNQSIHLPFPQTRESANKWLIDNGMTKKQFAEMIGVPRMTVVDVLFGRVKGARGKGHIAAVALGLKKAPSQIMRVQA